MSLSRRTFLKDSLLTATATGVVGQSLLNAATLEKIDYSALRKQLREYYPDECHGRVSTIRT